MIGAGIAETEATAQSAAPASRSLLVMVVALFFVWGGVTSLNDILIPKLKSLFQLGYMEAMLIQFAFFTAYAIISIPAGRLVIRIGYGGGIVAGLAVMAAGCLLFIPATSSATFGLFLGALFVLAGGITLLQVAANPLIAGLGPRCTSHSRLTFAQAFNSLGTTIIPYLGAQIILGSVVTVNPATLSGADLASFQVREAGVIADSYLGIAIILVFLAGCFWVSGSRLNFAEAGPQPSGSLALLRRPRLGFGVLAIFVYVGAEVTIGSVLVNYLMLSSTMGLAERTAGEMIALYWGGAMVGRFAGAGLLRIFSPGNVLACAALGAVFLVALSSLTTGPVAGWSLIAVGLMNAIMFPTIFSLALEGLGDDAPRGSGMLCMAIVGGALVPLLAGAVADGVGLAVALAIPAACYAIIAAFGWFVRSPAVD